MQKSPQKTTHTETNTTVNVRASYFPFSCGFFCNRRIDLDVIEPSKSSKKELNEHLAIEPANPGLCNR